MALLIDGYNLLHGTDLFGVGPKAGSLEASRNALVDFVASAVSSSELSQTTIVFDSKEAPPGLPRVVKQRGLTIRYASDYADADELLAELIQADNAPQKLLVVSSDHQVQRAARRRRAKFVDSHQWYFDMRRQASHANAGTLVDAKPEGPLSAEETAAYLREFGAVDLEEPSRWPAPEVELPLPAVPVEEVSVEESPTEPPAARRRIQRRRAANESTDRKDVDLSNPFPPGYGEDLLKGEGND